MPPVLGNFIVILAVAALAFACARYLWLDHKRGGGCASCGGQCSHGGGCSGCAGCSAVPPEGFTPIDVSGLRVRKPVE